MINYKNQSIILVKEECISNKECQFALRAHFEVYGQLGKKVYFCDYNWFDAMNNQELNFNKLATERIKNDIDSGNINLSDIFHTKFNGMDFLLN